MALAIQQLFLSLLFSYNAMAQPPSIQEPIKKEVLQFMISFKIAENSELFKNKNLYSFCFFDKTVINELADFDDTKEKQLKDKIVKVNVISYPEKTDSCDVYILNTEYDERIKAIQDVKQNLAYMIINLTDKPYLGNADASIYQEGSRLKYHVSNRLNYDPVITDLAANVPFEKTTMFANLESRKLMK